MNKKYMYNRIMESVAKEVKKALLNEDLEVLADEMEDEYELPNYQRMYTNNSRPSKFKSPKNIITREILQEMNELFAELDQVDLKVRVSTEVITVALSADDDKIYVNPGFIDEVYETLGKKGIFAVLLHTVFEYLYTDMSNINSMDSDELYKYNFEEDRKVNNMIIRKYPYLRETLVELRAIIDDMECPMPIHKIHNI